MTLPLPQPPRALIAAITCVVACGCEAEPPAEIEYETEHLRIGTTFDEPLCQGDLERYESWFEYLEEALVVSVDDPVTAYLWTLEEFPVGELCSGNYIGCYIHDTRTIYSSIFAFDHEIVHAVAGKLGGDPAPLFSEGAAEALRPRRTIMADASPLMFVDQPLDSIGYQVAGHFARWLWETQGPEKFRALLQTSGDARPAFESVYGMTLEAAAEQYLAEAPHAYAPLVSCEDPLLPEVGVDEWSENIVLDCDGTGIYGGPYAMGAGRVLEVDAPATFALSSTAEGLNITRCPDEDLLEAPVDGDPMWGDVPPVTEGFREQYVLTLAGAGEVHELDLVPGRFLVHVFQEARTTATVDLDVQRLP